MTSPVLDHRDRMSTEFSFDFQVARPISATDSTLRLLRDEALQAPDYAPEHPDSMPLGGIVATLFTPAGRVAL